MAGKTKFISLSRGHLKINMKTCVTIYTLWCSIFYVDYNVEHLMRNHLFVWDTLSIISFSWKLVEFLIWSEKQL